MLEFVASTFSSTFFILVAASVTTDPPLEPSGNQPPPFDERSIPPIDLSIHFERARTGNWIGACYIFIDGVASYSRATFAAESNLVRRVFADRGGRMVIRSSFRGENSRRIRERRGEGEGRMNL